jgi:hypothetical protein
VNHVADSASPNGAQLRLVRPPELEPVAAALPSHGSASASGWGVLLVAAFGLVVMAAQRDFGAHGFWVPLVALALALLCLAPAACRLVGIGRDRPVPFLVLFGVIYAVYFALPALVADRVGMMSVDLGVPQLERALVASLIGLVCLFAGYGIFGQLDRGSAPARLAWDPARALTVAWILLPIGAICHVSTLLFELPGGLRQPVHLFAKGTAVALGILFVLARRGHLPRSTARLVFFVLAPLLMFSEVADAAIGQALRTGIFFLMLVWGTGGRVPMWLMLLGAFGAATLRGGADEFRSLEQHHPHLVAEAPLERAGQFVALSASRLVEDSGDSAASTLLDRVSQVALLGQVMEFSPQAVPYWGGSTLATLPATVIPRALWPNKPTKELGQAFGHRYGLLAADDFKTSVNLPQLIELFANFGLAGIVLGMAFLGAVYRWLSDRLNRPGAGDGGVVLSALLFSTLAQIESDLSLVFGASLQIGILFFCVLWLARPRRSSGPVALARVDGTGRESATHGVLPSR